MIKIVFINGIAGSGKGEFVAAFAKIASEQGIFTHRLSTIDTDKDAAERYYGVPREPKTDAKRLLWNRMKAARTEYNDGPFWEAVNDADLITAIGFQVCFFDVREPPELEKFKKHYGARCLAVLIRRPLQAHIPNNPADQSVEGFDYDLVYENTGTLEDLKPLAADLLEKMVNSDGNQDIAAQSVQHQ